MRKWAWVGEGFVKSLKEGNETAAGEGFWHYLEYDVHLVLSCQAVTTRMMRAAAGLRLVSEGLAAGAGAFIQPWPMSATLAFSGSFS